MWSSTAHTQQRVGRMLTSKALKSASMTLLMYHSCGGTAVSPAFAGDIDDVVHLARAQADAAVRPYLPPQLRAAPPPGWRPG